MSVSEDISPVLIGPRSARVVILQTCVPDYRLSFFDALYNDIRSLLVISGDDYFENTVQNCAAMRPWFRRCANSFFARRSLLWQDPFAILWRSPDVLVVEWNPRIVSNYVLLLLARLTGAKVAVWGHASGRSRPGSAADMARKAQALLAGNVICYTQQQARAVRANFGGGVYYLGNSCLSASDCGVDLPPAGKRNTFIYVGRLVPRKKVALLVRGFARARELSSSFACELTIVGEGPEGVSLRRLAAELGVEERVRFFGHISKPADLRPLYSRAVASVSPGYVGLSVIQSFGFGVPALVAREEPHSPEIEACVPDTNTRFFTSDDVDALAQAMLWAVKNWSAAEELRVDIANRTRENYTYESMASRCADALRSISKR